MDKRVIICAAGARLSIFLPHIRHSRQTHPIAARIFGMRTRLYAVAVNTKSVERLQQQRPQQPFRRDRRPAIPRAKLGKFPRQLSKRRIDKLADRSQWMVRCNPVVQPHIAEKNLRAIILAAHRIPQQKGINHMHRITLAALRESTFSAAC
jgi:hypothetical protein